MTRQSHGSFLEMLSHLKIQIEIYHPRLQVYFLFILWFEKNSEKSQLLYFDQSEERENEDNLMRESNI